jgi:hypothetical protein
MQLEHLDNEKAKIDRSQTAHAGKNGRAENQSVGIPIIKN